MVEVLKETTPPEDFNSLLFVCRALSKDESRPFLMALHIEKRKGGITVVATDGSRLHLAELSIEIAPGEYSPLITKSSIILKPVTDITFPNWRRVVPQPGSELAVLDIPLSDKKQAKSARLTRHLVMIFEHTRQAIDIGFLDDLSAGAWKLLGSTGSSKAILFMQQEKGKERNAVIMPLSLNAA
jgi:hypothetical protein